MKSAPESITVKARAVGHKQERWLRTKIETMLKDRLIVQADPDNAHFAARVFIVPKKGPAMYRMVVNMKPLNKWTVGSAEQLPVLEHQLSRTSGAQIFGTLDIKSGYDQVKVKEECRKFFGLMTPWGTVYHQCSMPQGWTNSPMLFHQLIVEHLCKPTGMYMNTGTGVMQWIDDTCLFAKTEEEYLGLISRFILQLQEKQIRMSLKKCVFAAKQIEYCGRRITSRGWSYLEEYYAKILRTTKPTYHHQMAEILYLATWLSPTIPGLVEYRQTLGEQVNMGGSMNELKKLNLEFEWTDELHDAWTGFLRTLSRAARKFLQMYDPDKALNVFTDASQLYWGCVVTQCRYDELEKPEVREQIHFPIMFFSGKFGDSQVKWHISSKELYPLLVIGERLDYMILGHPKPTNFYTDHKNLVYILDPQQADNRSYADRLHRWGLRLQRYNVLVHHIEGERNVFADLLSRWGNEHAIEGLDGEALNHSQLQLVRAVRSKRSRARKLLKDKVKEGIKWWEKFESGRISIFSPLYEGSWKQLSEEEVLEAQKSSPNITEAEKTEIERGGGMVKRGSKIWIPENISQKFLLHFHAAGIHRNISRELEDLQAKYTFDSKVTRILKDIMRRLRTRCLHCSRFPKLIRRPRDITILGKKCRDVLLMDYLYINPAGYIVVLVDSLSRKCMLMYEEKANVLGAIRTLMRWRSHFGFVDGFTLFTDRGSHFCNILMARMQKLFRFTQRWAISYAPWTNGGVETTNGPILKALRSLVSEYRLDPNQWPELLPEIEHVLNNTPRKINKGLTANEVFLFFKHEDNFFDDDGHGVVIYDENTGKNVLRTPLDRERLRSTVHEMGQQLEQLWSEVYDHTKLVRERENDIYSNRPGTKVVQFQEGDWVLVSRANTTKERFKEKLRWNGPYQMTKSVSQNVYEVQDLYGKANIVHASRLLFYEPDGWIPDEAIIKQFTSDTGKLEVEKFIKLRSSQGQLQILVEWKGFPEEEATWEPLETMLEDLPDLTKQFIYSLGASSEKDLAIEYSKQLMKTITVARASGQRWSDEEYVVLERCILKFGLGNYVPIITGGFLPGKSKQSLYLATQKLVGKQSIKEYSGLQMDVGKAREDNLQRYGTRFYVERSRIVARYERLAGRFFNLFRYARCKWDVDIPFFRRNETPMEREDSLRFLLDVERGKRDKTQRIPPIECLSQEIRQMMQVVKDDRRDLKLRETKLEKALHFVSHVRTCLGDTAEQVYRHGKFPGWLAKRDGTRLCYDIFHDDAKVTRELLVPTNTATLKCDVRELDWDRFALMLLHMKGRLPDVLLADPPWRVAQSNPVRGVALKYNTMSLKEIQAIPLGRIVRNGYFMCWITKSTREAAVEWAKKNQFKLKHTLYWIKRSKKGKLQTNTGGLIHSAVEELLVFKQGSVPSSQVTPVMGNDVMTSPRLPSNEKPDELKKRIEGMFDNGFFVELFARNPCVTETWVAVGEELSYTSSAATEGYCQELPIRSDGVESTRVSERQD
eukprot:augustus_masked-scaffold_8-processed-gene-6.62-mRNA-1 protein AED:0.40 eAED:0.40 QI:0/-1/0/1/-1/1/1/0/1501